jgi:hypothetical protein
MVLGALDDVVGDGAAEGRTGENSALNSLEPFDPT